MNEGIVPNDLRQSVEDIISGKKSLYQINSDTFNHAVVNVKAVYEKNVTKVVDSITRKKLYLFNVEESKEILWDVIFLSKIVKNQAQEDKYGNKIINSAYYKDIFNQKFDINNLDSKINKVQLLLVSADLEENVKKEIKEAIVILNDLRNALAHNDNSSYETDEENEQIKFHSDSKDSELYCDIPVRYLLKLGSGIVPLPEHEKLARETDIFIDYTCTNLNINLKELPNFFYRAKPENINYLLSICDYDYTKLKDLSASIFFADKERIKWLIVNYCKVEEGYEISKLKDLPDIMFSGNKEIIEWLIVNYCKVDEGYEISKLKDLPASIFYLDIKEIKWLSDRYCKVNEVYEISKLKDLPDSIFYGDKEKIEWLIVNYCKVDEGYEISKLKDLSASIFFADKERIKWLIVNYCKVDEGYEISKLKDLPASIFSGDKEIIEWLIVNYCKVDEGYEISKLKDLSASIFYLDIKEIKWLSDRYCKVNEVYEISKLKDLPGSIFYGDKEIIEWFIVNYCKVDEVYEISKLKDLPNNIFSGDKEIIEWLIVNYCKVDEGYEISKLKDLPDSIFFGDKEKIEWLIVNYCKVDEGYEISKLKDLPDNIFFGYKERIEWLIVNYCKVDEGYEISKLKDLPDSIFFEDKEKIEWLIVNYCKVDEGYEISKLKDLPASIFFADKEKIEWIVENYCISNGKYDISKLKGIPSELFQCDIELLKQIGKHNDMNLLKSILGNGNDKLMALIIYMDSLFSAYDVKRKVTNLDLMNVEFDKVHPNIQSGVDSINKSYNSSNFDKAQEDYFLGDLTDMIRKLFEKLNKKKVRIIEEDMSNNLMNLMNDKIQSINVELIRMLRNSSQHFHVKIDEENPDILVISDYEKEFDFGNVSNNVKSIFKITIEEFFKLLKSIELSNEQEETTKENYTINKSGENLLQNVKEKYDSIVSLTEEMKRVYYVHTCLKIEGYNSAKKVINGNNYISYTNGKEFFADTIDNLWEIYNSYNKIAVFNAATLFIELLEFDKDELLLQDLFDINLIAEELLIADDINYSKKIQNNEILFEIDGKTKKAINIYKEYKNDKNKSHVFTEVLIDECRNAYGNVYSKSR